MIEIIAATAEEVHKWYDGPPAYTMKGYVIRKDGEQLAIGGYFVHRGKKYMFSEAKEEVFKYKKTLIKAAKQAMKDVEGLTVYAVATEGMATAKRFIEHFGFECVDPKRQIYRRPS